MNLARLAELHRELARIHAAIAAEYEGSPPVGLAGAWASAIVVAAPSPALPPVAGASAATLAIGLSFEEMSTVDLGECPNDGPACACAACRMVASFMCACGVSYEDHPGRQCQDGGTFFLAGWFGGPQRGQCLGTGGAHRRDRRGRKCLDCGFPYAEGR